MRGPHRQQRLAELEQLPDLQTLVMDKRGFNQNYYTFTLILLTQIVMCSNFP